MDDDTPRLPDDEWAEWMASAPPDATAARRLHPLVFVAGAIAVVVVVGLVVLWPTGEGRERAAAELSALGVPSDFFSADVVDVETAPCDFAPDEQCITVGFELTAGPDAGRIYEQFFSPGGANPDFSVGQTAILSYRPGNAVVVSAEPSACDFDPGAECTNVSARLLDDGRTVTYQVADVPAAFPAGTEVEVFFREGAADVEVVGIVPVDFAAQYQFSDFQRRSVLVWILGAFAVAVVALGGWRGVAALAGLGATVLVAIWWLLPAILDGRNSLFVALFAASAIAYLALYLAHGFSLMTTVALLGTIAALVLTTLLAGITVVAANFTGLASEESTLLTLFEGIDIRGLVLAGMVLGAAGALDDVTVTQASAVWQLHRADPSQSTATLFRRGLSIGRDHIGSTVNTLLLAYLGAALPLAVLFVLSQQSLGTVVNSEVVAIEVARTLVGSIGLVAAVPITTYLAARVVTGRESVAATS